MLFQKMLADLHLFDGGTAAAGGASGAAVAAGNAGAQGDTNGTVPGVTRRGRSGEYANVKFGKQETPAETTSATAHEPSSDAGSDKTDAKAPDTLKDRRKAFDKMINGEFKDIFAEKTQHLINARFKEAKNLEAESKAAKPIMDMLLQRYNIADGDLAKLQSAIEQDNAYWSQAAAENGMSVEQYVKMQRLNRENEAMKAERERAQNEERANARIQGWIREGEALKAKFPDFDFYAESEDPGFMSMLRAGIPVEHAYKVKHFDRIMADTTNAAKAETEKRIVDNVRASGTRPVENGAASQSAFTVKDDVTKLSKADRAEIARRAIRGENIKF